MKVSVVVPVYNVKEYLNACVHSVLTQTYQLIEIVLVDDGSTDGSDEICDAFMHQYPDIVRVLHTKNQGPMKARIMGVSFATGEICVFLDSDDMLREDAIATIVDRFALAECDLLLFEGSQKHDFSVPFDALPFENNQCFSDDEKNKLYDLLIRTRKLNPLVWKAVKTKLFDGLPEVYATFLGRSGEDMLLSMYLLERARRVCCCNEVLYFYRIREFSIVHTYDPLKLASIRLANQELERFILRVDRQEMLPIFYGKVVQADGVCLKQLLACAAWEDVTSLMQELSEDEYFRNAYQKMAPEGLSKLDARMARWLYERKYGLLKLLGGVIRLKRKLQKLKNNK